MSAPTKYIPPHLRRQLEESARDGTPAPSFARSFRDTYSAPTVAPSAHGWSTRDGRRPNPEYANEVFKREHVTQGIKFDDYDKIPVEISGRDAQNIHPIERFKDASLDASLMDNIDRAGYVKPTPVQKHSVPIILAGRDLMASAQTGSGKTAGFLLPTIQRMLKNGPPSLPVGGGGAYGVNSFGAPISGSYGGNNGRKQYPTTLILAPTRELAVQIFEEARRFCFGTGVRAVVLYGGADIRGQLRELERGCDICIACPGRLLDMIQRGRVSVECVETLILDEADRMLDMGFEPQIREIVDKYGMAEIGRRQSVMFSATFPKEIQRLARDFLDDYVFLTVGRVGSTHQAITQEIKYVEEQEKYRELCRLLKENGGGLTLVFVETKRRADELEESLSSQGFLSTAIHGDREQVDREEALRLFKSGRRPVLVATDVASRGLDINNVQHVVNFDMPKAIDDYVHRIGRTGRAGNVGKATAFVNEGCKQIVRDLLDLLEESNQNVPDWFRALVERAGGRGFGGGRGTRGGRGGRGGFGGNRDIRGGETRSFTHGAGDQQPRQFGGDGSDRFGGRPASARPQTGGQQGGRPRTTGGFGRQTQDAPQPRFDDAWQD